MTSSKRGVAVLLAALVACTADPTGPARSASQAHLDVGAGPLVLEAEQARWTASGGERARSRRDAVELSGREVGGRYAFVQAVPEGTYRVALRVGARRPHGTYRVAVNGRSIGLVDGDPGAVPSPSDRDADADDERADRWETVRLGTATSAGTLSLELVHVGATVGRRDAPLRIDAVLLTPEPSPFRAYWSFDSADGAVVPDLTGHGFPLTLSGGASVDAAGVASGAVALLGADASALAPGEVLDASASFSLSLWAELDELHPWDTFASQDGQYVSAFFLQKRDSGRLAFTTLPEDSTAAQACVAMGEVEPTPGRWYHLVATWDAATRAQRLYVDGVLSGLASCPGGFKATGPLVVGRGRWWGPADWMHGRVDEMGVVDRALSPEEVVDLYRRVRPDTAPAARLTVLSAREQTWSAPPGARVAKGPDGVRLRANAVGDRFSFTGAVPAGGYRARAHVAPGGGGVFDVSVDGRRVATLDGAGRSRSELATVDLGMVVSSGALELAFELARPAASGRSATLAVDWISLEPSPFDAYWSFDSEDAGQVPDVSGHGVPLTLENASLAEGPTGRHVALAGEGTSASAPSGVLDASASFSVSAWTRLDQLDAWNTFVSQDGRDVSAFYLQKRDRHQVAFTTFPRDSTGASPCIATGALRPKAGEWYHLVATRDAASGEQRLYVDGVLSGRAVCVGGFKATGPLAVGRGRWGGPVDFMRGAVDELGVSRRVLTADEVLALYHAGRPRAASYLFAYFSEQARGRGDGLRLAQSHDGLSWGGIGADKVFLPPTVGGRSFRDPHVMRDPRGDYHLVWTTSCVPWAEPGCVQDRGFGHARSRDLVHWSAPTYVPVDLPVEHVWAPETLYDEATRTYLVYWSSPLALDPTGPGPHRIYAMRTPDFRTFTAPAMLYTQPGRDFIDATITRLAGEYLMFLKDEAASEKNIRVVTSPSPFEWTAAPSERLTGNYGAEGPSVLERDGHLFLYFDKYGEGSYGALRSSGLTALSDPASWEDISSQVSFPGVRHGTPIEVPWEVFRAVALKAGE